MSLFDGIMFAMILISFVWGCKSGFVNEAFSLFSVTLGIFIPSHFIHSMTILIAVYLCILVVGAFLSAYLSSHITVFVSFLLPIPIQIILGGVLGGLKIFFLISIMLYALLTFPFFRALCPDIEKDSKLCATMLQSATLVIAPDFEKQNNRQEIEAKKQKSKQ